MKLAPLLTEYLYINKHLDLPGIGSFLLDPSVSTLPDNHKNGPLVNLAGVSFESNPSIKDAADLIRFISAQTGKMKALAASDLDSHLELAQQFLNIGKPFLFEGIGSLVKVRSGQFIFTSGQVMPEKMKDYSAREISATSSTEGSFTDYNNLFSPGSSSTRWRKPVMVLLMAAGILFAIWAGYTVYKTTTTKKDSPISKTEQSEQPVIDSSSTVAEDTTKAVSQPGTGIADSKVKDSLLLPKQNKDQPGYKFIIEIANARRAAERFAKLKSYQWNIQMETRDSMAYKLYLMLPINASDTSRVLDSLTVLNGRKVYIEK